MANANTGEASNAPGGSEPLENETLAITQSLQVEEVSARTLDIQIGAAASTLTQKPDSGPVRAAIPPRPETRPAPIQRVGRYRVIRKLGEGGMGVVFSAFDDELARPVALKLLRTRRMGRTAQATEARDRMQREAQAMAQLSHPNVVQVYDVGEHEDEVFIAMELIRGRTLGEWLEELGEPGQRVRHLRGIVEHFVQAGRGLAAAHEQGIIHRDFKPANVLVGDDGGVRVLDFGLARGKLDAQSRSEASRELESSGSSLLSTMTRTGTLLGTPAYFSPEQMRAAAVDAASDQFSFCVALHEALYGVRPYAGDTFNALRDSLRHGTRAELPAAITLPGWLRAVLDRGLALDPRARWPSMDALLLALLDDPLERRRRRVALGVGGLLLAGLAAGAWMQETREQARCEALANEIELVWNEASRLEIVETFARTGVGQRGKIWDRLEPAVDDWAEHWREARLDTCFAARERSPLAQARADCLERQREQFVSLVEVLTDADRSTVFEAHNAIAALPPVERCSDPGWLSAEPPPPPWWLPSMGAAKQIRHDLAEIFVLERVANYKASEQLAASSLERARALGDETLEAEALAKLGSMRWRSGDYARAETELGEAHFLAGALDYDRLASTAALELVNVVGVRLGRVEEAHMWHRLARMHLRSMGDDPEQDYDLWFWLGELEYTAGDYEQALEAHERAYAVGLDTLSADHPDLASSLTNIGAIHRRLGHYETALDFLERGLALKVRALGPIHPDVAYIHDSMAAVLNDLGRNRRALRAYEQALAIEEETLTADHPDAATTRNNYATALYSQARYAEAAIQFERVLELRERVHGREHPEVAAVLNNLAAVEGRLGRFTRALELMHRVLRIEEASLGPDHADLAITLSNLGTWSEELGDFAGALPHYERALAICAKVYGQDHAEYARDLHSVARAHGGLGQHEQALELHRRAFEIHRESSADGHIRLALSHDYIGTELRELGQFEAALEHHHESLSIRESALGNTHLNLVRSLLPLAKALAAAGHHAEALAHLQRAREILEADPDSSRPPLLAVLEANASSLEALGRHDEAQQQRLRATGLEP